ncbi:MAG: DUF4290 domain-containing protein [Flavobacteriales bacterium]|nr:DUF4290 domain-containing protein [Flavobacteriales bacterium]
MSLDYEMEYNTAREQMQIPEYGRNIQKMIEFAKTLEDKNERNKAANSIIKVMGQVNPALKGNEDLTHKIWDHMFIISGFDFDVDSPFPKPVKEDFEKGPDKIPYPENEIAHRHYGRVIEALIKKVAAVESEEDRLKMGVALANTMKRAYLNWNRDTVENRVILKNLRDMSGGKINLPEDTELEHSRDLIDTTQQASNNQNRQRKGGGRSGGKRKKNNSGRRNPRN